MKMVCWKKEKNPKKRAELKKLHEKLGHKHDDKELDVMYA